MTLRLCAAVKLITAFGWRAGRRSDHVTAPKRRDAQCPSTSAPV